MDKDDFLKKLKEFIEGMTNQLSSEIIQEIEEKVHTFYDFLIEHKALNAVNEAFRRDNTNPHSNLNEYFQWLLEKDEPQKQLGKIKENPPITWIRSFNWKYIKNCDADILYFTYLTGKWMCETDQNVKAGVDCFFEMLVEEQLVEKYENNLYFIKPQFPEIQQKYHNLQKAPYFILGRDYVKSEQYNFSHLLVGAFNWSETPEGSVFWNSVVKKYHFYLQSKNIKH